MLTPQAETVLKYILENSEYPHEMNITEFYESPELDILNILDCLNELERKNKLTAIRDRSNIRSVRLTCDGINYFKNKETKQNQDLEDRCSQRRHDYVVAAFGIVFGAIVSNIDRIIRYIMELIS